MSVECAGRKIGWILFFKQKSKIAMVDESHAHQEFEYMACSLHCNSQHEQKVNLMVQTS
jgi:hypothetical protein